MTIYGCCDSCNKLFKQNDKYKTVIIPNIGKLWELQYCNQECLEKAIVKFPFLSNYKVEEKDVCIVNQNVQIIVQELFEKFPEYFIVQPVTFGGFPIKSCAEIIKMLIEINQSNVNIYGTKDKELLDFCIEKKCFFKNIENT